MNSSSILHSYNIIEKNHVVREYIRIPKKKKKNEKNRQTDNEISPLASC